MSDILTKPQADAETPAKGHNRPPIAEFYKEQNLELPSYVQSELEAITARRDELIAAFHRLPDKIEDADTAGKYTQLIGFVSKCVGAAEAKREDMTDGPLQAQRIIMAETRKLVFDKLGEPKTNKAGSWGDGTIKQIAQDRLTQWDKAQAEIKRKALEEEERKQREAEAAARKAAEEATRIAREAAEADARAKAEREKAMKDEQDLDKAIAAEAAEKAAKAERDRLAAEAAAKAEAARLEAEKAADAAKAKSSQLTHSVGAYGAKSSLRENWKARITDREKANANLSKIAAFFSADDIIKAATVYAKKNKDTTTIDGLEFYNDERSQVRG